MEDDRHRTFHLILPLLRLSFPGLTWNVTDLVALHSALALPDLNMDLLFTRPASLAVDTTYLGNFNCGVVPELNNACWLSFHVDFEACTSPIYLYLSLLMHIEKTDCLNLQSSAVNKTNGITKIYITSSRNGRGNDDL